jgi:GT2 family glycosyltransferase/glycosyltransferase involved in cell wall biosynthesis
MVNRLHKPPSSRSTTGTRPKRQGILVLGMHRSGTSSLSGTLVKLGVSPPKTLMQGKHDNPKGHWESEVLAAFHDELLASAGSRWDDWRPFRADWFDTPLAEAFKVRAKELLKEEFGRSPVFVLKDPRICRFARFWLEVFEEEGIEPKIVLPLRSPLEVAQSHRTRDGFPIQKGLLLWLRHVVDAEATSRDLPRGVFEWTALLKDWRAVALRLETSLETRWPAMTDFSALEVDRFLARDLKHESVPEAELLTHPQLHAWVIDAYEALRELARNPASNSARATLDAVRERFDDAARFFGGALAEIEVAYSEAEAMLRVEREAAARAAAELRQELEGVASREHQAQAALQEHHAAKAEEVERLTALVETTRASAETVQAAIRAEMTAALDAERQGRAADAAAHAAALAALEAERDAKAAELASISALLDATRASAEEALALVRRDLEALLDSEREARTADAAAHAAAIEALAGDRDAKAADIERLSQEIRSLTTEAQDAQARLTLEFETARADERQARDAEAAAHAEAILAIRAEQQAEAEQARSLLQSARSEFEMAEATLRQSAAVELAREQHKSEAVAAELAATRAALDGLEAVARLRDDEVNRLTAQLGLLRTETEAMGRAYESSTSWRLTRPLRAIKSFVDRGARAVSGTSSLVQEVGGAGSAVGLVTRKLAELGPRGALSRARAQLRRVHQGGSAAGSDPGGGEPASPQVHQEPVVASPHGDHPLNQRYRMLQEDAQRRFSPDSGTVPGPAGQGERIAILMPVYKVPVQFLRRTIDSVINQTHGNWELCIVDDFSQDEDITAALAEYAARDSRIKVSSAPRNLGIAGASNMALSMIESRYFCLLDHDDLLTCDALECFARTLIDAPGTDVIYSDECKIDENDVVHDIFVKPDWDPFLLHNSMYIGHLTLYRTEIVRNIGGFRSDYDLSQDYDLALRVTEAHNAIVHLQKVLYGWRMIPQSAASGGKPHARITNIAALQDAMNRRGWAGSAVALPAANRVVRDRSLMHQKVGIIIPSDNVERIIASIASIRSGTTYTAYEIVVVTNSPDIRKLRARVDAAAPVKFVPYDLPFNFSDKCNRGAEATDADVYVFYNDDVRVKTADWVESLLDYVVDPEVGAVGPKLLYENHTIQHAGMVTGVRGLFGTAFHVLNGDSSAYFNFIQSVRQVSNICGACLAMRKEVFWDIGGFDGVDFPIAHSDGDLCFKVRAAGLACVYTPHAELFHIGHVSIGETKKVGASKPKPKTKVDIKTLKKWPEFISYDPFFHPQMAGILYHDSQQDYHLLPPAGAEPRMRADGRDILLVFHDLTNSGAPRVLFEVAVALVQEGHFVVAVSPADGPYAAKLRANGVFVVIDELILSGHPSVHAFARNFDVMVANTVVAWPIVAQCAAEVETYWYIHESRLVSDICAENPEIAKVFKAPKQVWATCERVRAAVAPYRPDVTVNEVGLFISPPKAVRRKKANSVVVAVVGSIEERKGQDLAIAAIEVVRQQYEGEIALRIIGRTLDHHFHGEIRRLAGGMPHVTFVGALSPEGALEEISAADILLIPSRDEPFSLVGAEAMALGKVVVLGPEVGLAAYLKDGENGFVAPSGSPQDLANALTRALQSRRQWAGIGRAARSTFDRYFTLDQLRKRMRDALARVHGEAA